MSEIYARYIPPSTSQSASPTKVESNPKRPNTSQTNRRIKKRKLGHTENGHEVLSEYSVSEAANSPENVEVHKKFKKREGREDVNGALPRLQNGGEGPMKETGADSAIAGAEVSTEGDQKGTTKHSKVLSRFSKSKGKATQASERILEPAEGKSMADVHPDRLKFHDLAPLPQPEVSAVERAAPAYSTVPEWLRKPVRADQKLQQDFDNLGLHPTLLHNLGKRGKKVALPVQSAVLPLLLDTMLDRRPDLCIAAATGSGKTFAYLLPVLNDLHGRSLSRLQAVVVVPTRALVKQVMQALEQSSDGLGIHIGSAEGSKTLAEEQQRLVEEAWICDPAEYRKQQEAPVDWGNFSLDDILDDAESFSMIERVGKVKQWRSKVNVLVCTPGRLVEHLQSTKGFDLDDVQWFIVDEADRLLNESYHEWLDVVLPALKSKKATEKRDSILRQFRMEIPGRRVNKILLSATMTNDISRLLELELTNPALVVVEDTAAANVDEEEDQPDSNTVYQLPAHLHELAVAFKDSENKPLYLLGLLREHVLQQQDKPKHAAKTRNFEVPEGETSSSDSSSESKDSGTTDSSDSSLSSGDEDDSSSVSSGEPSTDTSSSMSSSSIKDKTIVKAVDKLSLNQSHSSRSRALIFTKSTESAHRLSRLLCLLDPQLSSLINTFTRSPISTTNDPKAKKENRAHIRNRNKILTAFTNGQIRILISTDLAGRGLDIPHLEHVVNYDVPASALTYVHRVGRTARAGASGQAWTLVEHKQGKWFWETIGDKSGKFQKKLIERGDKTIRKVNIDIDKDEWARKYEDALHKLGEDVRGQ